MPDNCQKGEGRVVNPGWAKIEKIIRFRGHRLPLSRIQVFGRLALQNLEVKVLQVDDGVRQQVWRSECARRGWHTLLVCQLTATVAAARGLEAAKAASGLSHTNLVREAGW